MGLVSFKVHIIRPQRPNISTLISHLWSGKFSSGRKRRIRRVHGDKTIPWFYSCDDDNKKKEVSLQGSISPTFAHAFFCKQRLANGVHILAIFDLILALLLCWWNWTAIFLPNALTRQLFAWQKSLVKSTPEVNFINVLRAAFAAVNLCWANCHTVQGVQYRSWAFF